MHPPLTSISTLALRTNLKTIIRQAVVEQKRFLVEKNGLPTVVILSARDYQDWVAAQSMKTPKP